MQKTDALSGPFISNFHAKEVVEMDFKKIIIKIPDDPKIIKCLIQTCLQSFPFKF